MSDATRLAVAFALTAGVGSTMLLSRLPWFARISLTERLTPHVARMRSGTQLSSWEVLWPVLSSAAQTLTRALGIDDDIESRLRRAGHLDSVSEFRMRQVARAGIGLCVGFSIVVAVRPPLAFAILMALAPGLLVFLVVEQAIVKRSERRQDDAFIELPIVAEQLAMLLGAGYSVGAAIARIAERSHGSLSGDLATVTERVRQGVAMRHALGEWAELVDIVELHRLVEVLALGDETSDLGALVSAEAKGFRAEAQRRLIEEMDKRAQQVWVPVTVATLVPGVIFLAIPFLRALEMFSGTS